MPLTELQLPTKPQFYNRIKSTATQINNLLLRWKDLAEFIEVIDITDLDNMGVPAGDIRTDLVDFRIMLNEVISLFEGEAVTPTKNPSVVIDRLREM